MKKLVLNNSLNPIISIFEKDDFNVQNAYKNLPIYEGITMKRISWEPGDDHLKTPESYRHIPLDILIKQLLINHKKQQKEKFKKEGKNGLKISMYF